MIPSPISLTISTTVRLDRWVNDVVAQLTETA